MADIGNLQLRITASAGDASRAINSLIADLGKLNMALNNYKAGSDYVKGIDNLVGGLERLGDAVSAIDPAHVKDIASSLGKLATNGDKLAKLSGKSFLSGIASESQKIAVASENARKKAEALAESYNFDKNDQGVDKLANAIDRLTASSGDPTALKDIRSEIESIIKSYARYENELHEAAKAENELIRNSQKKLNSGWQDVFGDSETARSARGKLGIGTSSKKGGSADSVITENESLGIQAAANETDNLALAFQRMQDNAYDAENAFVGFNDVSETVSGGIQQVRADIDELCQSLGIAKEKMQELSGGDDDGFMELPDGIDIDDDFAFLGGGSASQLEQVAAAEDRVSSATQQMAESMERAGAAGNLFTPVVEGLKELYSVSGTMPDMTPLLQLKDVLSKIGGTSGQNAAIFLPQIASGIQSLNVDLPGYGPQLLELAQGLRALGSGNIVTASQVLPFLADGLRDLNAVGTNVTANVEAISALAGAIKQFGYAKIDKTIVNLPTLAKELRSMMDTLSTAPQVSENTIMLLNALGKLNVNGANAMRSFNGLSGGLHRYTNAARRAHKQTVSLASVAGRMYANFFLLFRLFRKAADSIDLASQLKEVQNVVDVTFSDMSDKMNAFAKEAVDTIGMSELTAKQVGSRFQAMGSAMGISRDMVRETNDFVQTATNGYVDVANSMGDVSLNLTKLAGDMASFYNQDYEEVAERLNAVFTGQTRPLRAYGLDLTQATLSSWALANGLNADVKEMTQAEKTMLRYQYVMANTTAAQGDFERTINTWANQTRIAQERLKQLQIVLGQIGIYTFKPLVMNFNKAMNTIIDLATSTLNSLGKIFGWQIEWSDSGVLRDDTEGLEDVADGYDDAADSAKKFKNMLLGIDELNLLPDNSDKGKKDGDEIAGLYGDLGDMYKNLNVTPIEGYFDSLYDTLYKLGKRIGEVEKEWLQGINWERIFDKARRFGEGLADFLNGYLSDSELFYEKGKFIANGINTIANALDAFFRRFNGWQLGVDLGNMINGFTGNLDWNVIRSAAYEMAHDIAQTINGAMLTTDWNMVGSTIANGFNTAIDFIYTLGDEIKWTVVGESIANGLNGLFKDFDFKKAASALNKWAKGLLDAMITALKKTDWKMVGRQIGNFIAGIDVVDIAGKIGHLLLEVFNAGVKLWAGMFDSAPIETAIITALAIPFSNRIFRGNFGSLLNGFSRNVGAALSNDLTRVFNGQLANVFGNAVNSYFQNMDAVGMTGNMFTGVTNGINAVSSSLSPFTKVLGTATTLFAEFFAVKDAVYDLVKGTDNLGGSIAQLGIAAGGAAGALTLLLGVPAGIIVAGVGAVLGAVWGIDEATKAITRENVLSTLAKDMGDTYASLDDINKSFSSIADDITSGLDKLSQSHDKLNGLRSDLGDMVSKWSLIGEAANTGNKLTTDALHELVGNIGEVKNAWEDYIAAQYDYLIQATVNNMNFIKSQRELTDEETEYYTNKINELTEAKYGDIKAMDELADKADKAWNVYYNAVNSGADERVVDTLYEKATAATNAMYGLAESTGVITDERIKDINSSLLTLEEVTGKIHFPDINTDSYESAVGELQGYMDTFAETFGNATEKIDKYRNDLISEGMDYDDVILQTQAMYDQLDSTAKNAMDSVQLSLYDKLYSFIGKNDYVGAEQFYLNVMVPYTDMIKKEYGEATDGLEPWLAEKGGELMSSAFEHVYDYRDENAGGRVRSELSKDWIETFWEIRDTVMPYAEEAGEATGNVYANGVKQSTQNTGEALNAVGNVLTNGFVNILGNIKTLNDEVNETGNRTSESVGKVEESVGRLETTMIPLNSTFDTFKLFGDTGENSFNRVGKAGSGASDSVLNINRSMSRFNQNSPVMRGALAYISDELDKASQKANGMKGNLETLSTSFGTAKDKINNTKAFDGVKKSTDDVVTGFDSVKSASANLVSTLTSNLSVIGNLFSTTYNGISSESDVFMSSFSANMTRIFTPDNWNLNAIPNAFKTIWGNAIEAMKTMWGEFSKWVSANAVIEIPKTKVGNTEIGGQTIRMKIPRYETGGFPEDGLFFANHTEMVGSFSNGRTAVANNEQITEGIANAVYRAMTEAMAANGGNVNVELRGDAAALFTAVVKENNNYIMRTGSSPIRV